MKHILKADFKKLQKTKILYVLLVLAIVLPLFSVTIAMIPDFIAQSMGEEPIFVITTEMLYQTEFNPLNNFGLILLIIVVVLSSNEFNQFTMRNKIIAGHHKRDIFLSSVIMNVGLMFVLLLVKTTIAYLVLSIVRSFNVSTLLNVLKIGLISYSSLIVLYIIATVLIFRFKNLIGPLFLTIGGLMLLFACNFIWNALIVDFNFPQLFYYLTPIVRILGFPSLMDDFGYAVLVNGVYSIGFIMLGLHIAKKTDYK